MNVIIVLTIVAGLFSAILGTIVFVTSKRSKQSLWPFVLFAYSVAAWSVGIGIFESTNSLSLATLAIPMFYVAALFIAYSMLMFGVVFTKTHLSRPLYFIPIIPWLALVVVIIMPGYFIFDIDTIRHSFRLSTPLYITYTTVFLAYVVIGLGVMWNKSLQEKGNRKLKPLATWLTVCLMWGGFFNLVMPLFGNFNFITLGPLFIFVLVVAIFYLIIKRSLFDVRLAVVRTTTYVLTLLTLAALYFVIAFTISRLFLSDTALIQPAGVVIALVLAFVFQPIKTAFDRLTNRLFYKDNYSIDQFLSNLNHVLNSTTEVRELLRRAAVQIAHTLKTDQVFFFVFAGKDHYVSSGTPKHSTVSLKDILSLKANGTDFVVSSQLDSDDPIHRLLVSHRIELAMPLLSKDGLIGYLCLGEHRTSGYSLRDIGALKTISDELVIAIQNALSVQEVRELNETLQQRIHEATRELRASNSQLQRLDEAKDEFISMASHQLRTPLTSVKGYISMVVEGDAGTINEQQKHLLNEAFLSSERMVRLIGEFLNVSRLQTGKFMIEKHPTDLVQVVKQEIEGLKPSAQSRGLALTFVPPKKFPLLNIDENKLRQVIMNFSDNAIYYSKEKTRITLGLKMDGPDVVFTVKDTGIGVPMSEQASLFNKFFRATNARQQRPDGTGVGLFLAKKVIDAHHGTIIFESKEGRGSTFGFRLPLAAAKVEATLLPNEQSQPQPALQQ